MGYRSKGNLAIFGATQQGKTVGANEIAATDKRVSVMFAPDPESWFTGMAVSNRDTMIQGLKQGRRSFIVPVGLWSDVEEAHGKWTRWLLDRCNRTNLRVTMVHDEAQDLDADALEKSVKRGLKRGMRNIVVTQSPASRDVPLEVLRQCDHYIWVGPIGSFDVEYINRHGIFDPTAMIENDEHEYAVVTRTGTQVDRGQFDNRRFGDG